MLSDAANARHRVPPFPNRGTHMNFARIRAYLLVFSALATTVLSNIGQAQPGASWQLKAPMPTGRFGAPAAVIDGRLYVASGCCNDPFSPFPSRPNVLDVAARRAQRRRRRAGLHDHRALPRRGG